MNAENFDRNVRQCWRYHAYRHGMYDYRFCACLQGDWVILLEHAQVISGILQGQIYRARLQAKCYTGYKDRITSVHSTRHGCQASKHKQRIRRQSGGDFLLDFPFSPIIASIKCLCSPGKFWKLESRKCHFLHFGGRIYIILKFMKRAIKKYSKSIIWDRIKLFSEAGKTNATPIHIKLVSR